MPIRVSQKNYQSTPVAPSAITSKKRPPPMNIKSQTSIDPNRKVLYRNFHPISGKVYLVEISRNPLKIYILLFPNYEVPDIFLQETLSEKKAYKLMGECSNIFENLVDRFYVKFGKLQI